MVAAAFHYKVVTEWSADDAAFVGRVPAFGPGCVAHGETEADAAEGATAVALLMLDSLRDEGKPSPREDI